MKIDQLNNFTSDKINDILESRFGARIDLSEETVDTLTIFLEAIQRELDDMTASIGFNKSMQNPKFVENRLVFDLIANAIKEKKGKDHDGDGDIDSDDYMAAKDKAIKKAMGKDDEEDLEEVTAVYTDKKTRKVMSKKFKDIESAKDYFNKSKEAAGQITYKEDAKVKAIRGQKVDIEDPEKPGQVTTVDTSTTDIKRSMDDPDELEIVHKGKDMVQKGFNKGDASSPSKGIKVGQKVKMENDDIEDMVAPEFEKIIHMLKQGMSPEDIKAKMPKQADVVDQVVKDLTAVTEAMNAVLPEGTSLSGTELAALRLLVGTSEFMRAKRAIEFARAGRAIPSDLVAGLKPLFDKIGTFLSAGAGAVKRFGDIEKMIGRSVQKNDAYEDKLSSKLQIKESEMSKAEVALAAKDMVDKVDAMLQDVSQMKGEDLLPLTDKVRDEIGQEASDSLKTSVEGSLGELETALQSARTALDNAARTVAGDPSASAGDMGADPMADPTMPDPTNPDELNTLDVADPEIGGEEPEGREKRESVERTKHQIAENIFKTLAGKNKV
jgi:hypothetical protein